MTFFNDFAEVDREQNPDGENQRGQIDWLAIPDGETVRMRILTEPVRLPQAYVDGKYLTLYGKEQGCQYPDADHPISMKWLCYIDRIADASQQIPEHQIMLFSMTHAVAKQLVDLCTSDQDYDKTFPMPFDITVTRMQDKGYTKYTVAAIGAASPVEPGMLTAIASLTDCEEIVQNMKDKQKKNDDAKRFVQDDAPLPESPDERATPAAEPVPAVAYNKKSKTGEEEVNIEVPF